MPPSPPRAPAALTPPPSAALTPPPSAAAGVLARRASPAEQSGVSVGTEGGEPPPPPPSYLAPTSRALARPLR